MKQQFLDLWADAKAWCVAHPAITILSMTVVVLFFIAWAR